MYVYMSKRLNSYVSGGKKGTQIECSLQFRKVRWILSDIKFNFRLHDAEKKEQCEMSPANGEMRRRRM
jgi:hypothetical protein